MVALSVFTYDLTFQLCVLLCSMLSYLHVVLWGPHFQARLQTRHKDGGPCEQKTPYITSPSSHYLNNTHPIFGKNTRAHLGGSSHHYYGTVYVGSGSLPVGILLQVICFQAPFAQIAQRKCLSIVHKLSYTWWLLLRNQIFRWPHSNPCSRKMESVTGGLGRAHQAIC